MLIAARRARPDVAERRAELERKQPLLNPDRLVFIDETWAKTNMIRPRGRALRGERLLASVPHGHWTTATCLAALRTTGLTAPLVLDGAINGELFIGWARHHLVPTLQRGVVVMNNLAVHTMTGVREAIAAAGARVVYLPPYSPDLNPIKLVFSKFKWLLKSASARTVEALWSVCGDVLHRFTEAECRNCFQHRGYRYTEAGCAPATPASASLLTGALACRPNGPATGPVSGCATPGTTSLPRSCVARSSSGMASLRSCPSKALAAMTMERKPSQRA